MIAGVLAALLEAAVAEARDGIVLLPGDAEVPAGVPARAGSGILKALGWGPIPTPAAPPLEELDALARALTRWDRRLDNRRYARDAGAIAARLTGPIPAARVGALRRALYRLADAHLRLRATDAAARAMDRALALAPGVAPDRDLFSPSVRRLYEERTAAAGAPRPVRVAGPAGCRVLVNGVDVGPPGPVGAGDLARVAVALACPAGRTLARGAAPGDALTFAAWEIGLRAAPRGLRLGPGAPADAAARALMQRLQPPWVLVVGAELALYRGSQAPVRGRPADAVDWIRGQPGVAAGAAVGPRPLAAGRLRHRWWHWTIAGAGAALIAAGGAVTAVGMENWRRTSRGTVDLRADNQSLAIVHGVLYGIGGAALVTGVVLAVVGTPETQPTVQVSDRAAVLGVLRRF